MSEVKETTATATAEAAEPKQNYKDVEPNIQYEAVDWTTIGKKQDSYNSSEKSRLETLYSKTITNIAEHEVVEGVVVGKNEKEVIVRIGYKSDGVIDRKSTRLNSSHL